MSCILQKFYYIIYNMNYSSCYNINKTFFISPTSYFPYADDVPILLNNVYASCIDTAVSENIGKFGYILFNIVKYTSKKMSKIMQKDFLQSILYAYLVPLHSQKMRYYWAVTLFFPALTLSHIQTFFQCWF